MRNPNGFGSVSKLTGKRRRPWIARVTTGTEMDFENQKAKQIRQTVGYYTTKKEALEALAKFSENPFNLESSKVTFRQCYEGAKEDFSAARAHNYRSAFRYLEPIADLPIRSIKAAQMQKCIDTCRTTQQREIKTVCHKTYEFALKQEYIDRNPSQYLKSNTVEATIDREVFTPEEIRDLWNRDEWAAKVALVLLYSGMRTKEFRTMEPDDIDLKERVMHITKGKNRSSIRTVPIHDKILPILKDLKENPVQFTHNGFNKALSRYGDHTAHDCRHTFTSRMRELKCDLLTLQLILGHTPSTITERVYMHIGIDELRNAVNTLYYE